MIKHMGSHPQDPGGQIRWAIYFGQTRGYHFVESNYGPHMIARC